MTDIYAFRIKDEKELKMSSSGGAFTVFSNYIFKSGGAIVSAIYNYENNQMEFVLYTDKETRNKARGSKYVQAYPLNAFNDAENWLKNNDGILLFVGTGCQAEGFRIFSETRGFRERTIIIDIICHGVPSPKLWREYLNQKIDYVSFKDKCDGWKFPYAFIKIGGRENCIKDYVNIYYSNCMMRPSCYSCPYTKVERNTDITIGDFWGIDQKYPNFYSVDGNSLVLVHTVKGKEFFNCVKDSAEYLQSDRVTCLHPSLVSPVKMPDGRKEFWNKYYNNGMRGIIKCYGNDPFWRKAARKAKRLLKRKKCSIPESY